MYMARRIMAFAGDHRLEDGLLEEPFGGDDRDLPLGQLLPRGHAQHAGEVVTVAVGVDDGLHGPLAEVLVDQGPLPARAVSVAVSGSMTIQPVSPSMTVRLEMS